jgi:hypothetical protein
MSLPGIFTPDRSGKHLFADGFLLDNLPIGVGKEMGADVTLGIHLETAPLDPNTNLSSFGVLGQSISVMSAVNELRSMEQADILVTVPLQKYTSLDYNKADAIIKAGYDAAASKAAVLSAFSVSEADWEEYLANRNARRKTAPIPKFVEVIGTSPEMAKAMDKQMSSLVGAPVDTKKIDQDMMTIVGMGRFATSTYSMVEKNGGAGEDIQASHRPKPTESPNGCSPVRWVTMATHVFISKLGGSFKSLRHRAQSPRYPLAGWAHERCGLGRRRSETARRQGHAMTLRVIILGTTLLFSLPLSAQESKDVIVMKNGDRITGEIKGLSAGVLSVRVRYIDGRIAVQWSQVAHLESNKLYLVQTESGAVYTGKLSTSGESDDPPIRIEVATTPEREVEIAQRQIISLGPTSESFWHRFDGAINTGFLFSKGNESAQYNLSSQVAYYRERWSSQVNFNSTFASNSGAPISTRNQI